MNATDLIYTRSGFGWNPLRPDFDAIEPALLADDIAIQTSRIPRFSAATAYTVAEHSVALAMYALQKDPQGLAIARWCLMHDAFEGLTGGDVPRPWKRNLYVARDSPGQQYEPYERVEVDALRVIGRRLGLVWPIPDEAWAYDNAMMRFEARDLFPVSHRLHKLYQPLKRDTPPTWNIVPRGGASGYHTFCHMWQQLNQPAPKPPATVRDGRPLSAQSGAGAGTRVTDGEGNRG